MPPEFEKCRKAGGKIRTVKPKPGRYQRVCVKPGKARGPRGGKTVGGHVKRTKRGK